jgi:hypothetical protein
MSDSDQQRGRSSALTASLIVAVVVLPILYVLSVGPAAWLHMNGYVGDGIQLVYGPLRYVYENSAVAQQVLDWYLGLWGAL